MRDDGPIFHEVDDISVEYSGIVRGGAEVVLRRQLGKKVLDQAGGWATIAFAFQDWKDGQWQPVRFSLQRWRKWGERWRKISGIHLSSTNVRYGLRVFDAWDEGALVAAAAADSDAA